ncbi:MAG: four helix bundle protein [Patescibacteria group bacterium]
MIQNTNNKQYDLKERTFASSVRIKAFLKPLPKKFINYELTKQLLCSATSVGANYI